MKNKLKKYDKFLYLEKKLDGTKIIKRQSPFRVTRNFDILTLENKYIGSGLWLLKKLQMMDNQRVNIVGRTMDNNKKLYREKHKSKRVMHEEIADFLTKTVI